MGEDDWDSGPAWPPTTTDHTLYLHQGEIPGVHHMGYDAPVTSGILGYSYDPEDLSPTVGGPTLSLGLDQGPYDQVPEVESRDDNLIFSTSEFASTIEGQVRAILEFSSDAVDTDLVLRLTEVYPDGRSMLLTEAQLRLRHREGFHANDVVFLTPGEAVTVELAFRPLSHQIAAGNALRLVVTSSNYPRLNRNMNNGEDLYPGLDADALFNPVVASNNLHIGNSRLILPTTNTADVVSEAVQTTARVWVDGGVVHTETWNSGTAHLVDLNGRLIEEWKVENGMTHHVLSGISTGIYIVRVNGLNQVVFLP